MAEFSMKRTWEKNSGSGRIHMKIKSKIRGGVIKAGGRDCA
jgi:hypothetical protein